MTEEDIKALYRQIEGLETDEIKTLVDNQLSNHLSVRAAAVNSIGSETASIIKFLWKKITMPSLDNICKTAWDSNIDKIHTIITNNPKSSKTIMDILCLLAPTIAQQYTGFSGMAIVGSLTILCKHNLGL